MARVLIADGNVDAACKLAQAVTSFGHQVETAFDGKAAIAVLQRFHPQIALLDINMSRANGYEVSRFIRSQTWGRTVTIVAITGLPTADNLLPAGASGIDLHFTKPMDPNDLEEILTTHPSP